MLHSWSCTENPMLVTIAIFIIVLALLVFVHEFGHFIVAKKSGMVVEEFGFGFPPRIAGIQRVDGKWKFIWGHKEVSDKDQTVYSINWVPLGGFVRILGENNEDENNSGSFINKSFAKRFWTLVAGVCMNIILAWVIFSAGYMIGLPVAVDTPTDIPAHAVFSKPQVAILDVQAGSPADKAGVQPNDILLNVDGRSFTSISDLQNYINSHEGQQVNFEVQRGSQDMSINVTPRKNPPVGQGATGIELSLVGRLKYPWYEALWQGAQSTYNAFVEIVLGLYQLIAQHAGLSSLGGPVKIAKLTGEVAGLGFVYLMQFTAFLSLNLAVLNILPFPALDGGRVLFLLIEKIRGKRNNQKIEQWVNTIGFALLILLMAVVTVNDIVKR